MLVKKSGFGPLWICCVLLLGWWPAHCYSQSSDGDAAYHISFSPSKTGGTVVFSGPKHALAVDIVSDDIRTTDNPNYLIVDNRPFQASMVPLPNGIEGSSLPVALDLNCALTDLKDTEKARALLVRTAGTLRSLPDKK